MSKRHDSPTYAHRRRKSEPSQREQIRAAQASSLSQRKPKPPTLKAPLKLKQDT